MKVVIVEDEVSALDNLKFLLDVIPFELEIVKELDTVRSSIDFFQNSKNFDVVLMDIHLGDGISFDIFKSVEITAPIIFITAYDEYAIQAFKVNSIDYLLKPILERDLVRSFEKLINSNFLSIKRPPVQEIINQIKPYTPAYKATFLAQKHDGLVPIKARDMAIIRIDLGIVKVTCFNSAKYTLTGTLEDLEKDLNPKQFYRANRQFIINRDTVDKISTNFNGKLSLFTTPKCADSIVISKAKAKPFKLWISKD